MRVLHVNSSSLICGGVEVYLRDLFDGLVKRGIEPILAYEMGDGSEFPGSRKVMGLNDDRIVNRRDRGFHAVRSLLSELRPDVIHVHAVSNHNTIAACLDAAPTFLHIHDYRYLCPASTFHFRATGTNCSLNAGLHCLVRACTSHCVSRRPDVAIPALSRVNWVSANFGRFAHIFANSTHVHRRLLSAGAPSQISSVLHYFCSYPAAIGPAKPASPPYVLFVGRLSPMKGTEDFVRCVASLPPGVRGLVVGEGTRENTDLISRTAVETGCDDRIDLIPWKSRAELARVISAAAATIFPSIWEEPFGLVGPESQVLGVPVVGYAHGGVTDWLEHDVTGLSVPPRDVAGLAHCVRRIMEDADLRSRLTRKAAESVAAKFGREMHLDRLIQRYQSVIASPSS
jgi:glycosyltransferase involved in cell wall biosynthesis